MATLPGPGSDFSSLEVLVVDDNQKMLRLLRTILTALGVKEVRTSSSAEDAFDLTRSYKVDLIICDRNMTPVDGLTFVRMVRTSSESSNPKVPIIMLTGFAEKQLVLEAQEAGADAFLTKPVSAKALSDRMQALING